MPQGLVLSHTEVVLDDTEWLVSKLKGDSEWVHAFAPLQHTTLGCRAHTHLRTYVRARVCSEHAWKGATVVS